MFFLAIIFRVSSGYHREFVFENKKTMAIFTACKALRAGFI
jgi:hypothetical protein